MDVRSALKLHFGFEAFRPGQEEIVSRLLAGRDVLGVLPTGAGKSLCFQLPALLLPRPTLVVSPLIALMKDQLDGLPQAVRSLATLINSSIAPDEMEERLAGLEDARYRLVYVSPERLRQKAFLARLRRVGLSLVVVDEAHCVGVWGHDFRPDYLFIRKALESICPEQPPTLLAVTATATPAMRDEIARQLGRSLETVVAPLFRPNLRFEVFRCADQDAKMERLLALCQETPGATIVYAGSRERCERLAQFLRRRGLPAVHYHAGLDREARRRTQEQFMEGRAGIVVATVAFGMGVDKANVRLVAHFSLPESLEAYTQEAGRAGRDGRASRCALLYSSADKGTLTGWMRRNQVGVETVRDVYRALQGRLGKGAGGVNADVLRDEAFAGTPGPEDHETRLRVAISLLERCGLVVRHPDVGRDMWVEMLRPRRESRAELDSLLVRRDEEMRRRLAGIVGDAEGAQCRHAVILRHFGETMGPCGHACDVCLGTVAPPSARPAPGAPAGRDVGRVILECARSVPFALGARGLAKVLRGAPDSPVDGGRCPQHGALADRARGALQTAIERLLTEGLLSRSPEDEYRRLFVTPAGARALAGDATILPDPPATPREVRRSERQQAPAAGEAPTDDECRRFEMLRAWRLAEARRAAIAPFVILHDSTLRAIARANPTSLPDLAGVHGIGPTKTERYGQAILAVLHGEEAVS